jgi:hypothetical protein
MGNVDLSGKMHVDRQETSFWTPAETKYPEGLGR